MAATASLKLAQDIQVASHRYMAARRRLLRVGLLFALAYWLLAGWSLQQSWSRTLQHSLDSAAQAGTHITDRLNLSIDLAQAVFATTDITLEQVPDPYTVKVIVKPMTLATLQIFDSLVFTDQQERSLAQRTVQARATYAQLPACPAPAASLPAGQLQLSASGNLLALLYKPLHGWTPELWLCAKLVRSELNDFLQAAAGTSGLDLALLDLTSGQLLANSGGFTPQATELQAIRTQVALPPPAGQALTLPGGNWLQSRQLLLSRVQGYPLAVIVQVANRALLHSWFQQSKWLLPLSLLLMLMLVLAYFGSLRFIRALDFAATHDGLTQLFTRRHALELALQVRAMARRQEQDYSLILIDVDHFKNVNDRYGHGAGDAVLQGIAAALQQAGRKSDLVGRYGGEEFIVVLPATDADGATLAAERLRQAVASRVFSVVDQVVPVTISLGYISDDGHQRLEDLLNAADQALYRAKAAGRNCLVQASPLTRT